MERGTVSRQGRAEVEKDQPICAGSGGGDGAEGPPGGQWPGRPEGGAGHRGQQGLDRPPRGPPPALSSRTPGGLQTEPSLSSSTPSGSRCPSPVSWVSVRRRTRSRPSPGLPGPGDHGLRPPSCTGGLPWLLARPVPPATRGSRGAVCGPQDACSEQAAPWASLAPDAMAEGAARDKAQPTWLAAPTPSSGKCGQQRGLPMEGAEATFRHPRACSGLERAPGRAPHGGDRAVRAELGLPKVQGGV